MNGNRTTWPHLAQASRVSLQKPQFPQPSTGSRSFLANSLRSSVYLCRTDFTDVRFITDACSSNHLKCSFLATKKKFQQGRTAGFWRSPTIQNRRSPSDGDVRSANRAVLPHICPLAGWRAVPHLCFMMMMMTICRMEIKILILIRLIWIWL